MDQINYTYDAQGNMIMESYVWMGGHTEFTYDAQGNMLSETFYNSEGGKEYERDYTYDAYGNKLSDLSGGFGCYWTYTYDAQGNILNESGEGSGGYYYAEYTYDGQGNVLTCKKYSSEGDLDFEVIYEYYDSFAEAVAAGEEYLANKAASGAAASTGWKQDYIAKIKDCQENLYADYNNEYGLIYIDDDDIPELVLSTDANVWEMDIFVYGSTGKVCVAGRHALGASGFYFKERENMAYVEWEYGMSVYEDDYNYEFTQVDWYKINERCELENLYTVEKIEENEIISYKYSENSINGYYSREISKAEYDSYMKDANSGQYIELWDIEYLSADEMIQKLQNW